ncbi:MAG: acyl carrier protein [Syntrophomonadaceae bacterium]|nr:acyl carrier protein [Syntrophomonadaceae bacterium]
MAILKKDKDIIVDILVVAVENITEDSKLVADLEADSLDIVEMLMQMEDKFGLQIPESTAEDFKTVKDVVDYLEKRLQEK